MDVSFGLFSDAENRQALANVTAALRPGGRLLLDLFNPRTVQQLMRQTWRQLPDSPHRCQLDRNWLDPQAQTMYFETQLIDLERQLEENPPSV